MREALKTNISKYGPKTNAAMTVENVQGKGLQLVVIYAGKKHYLPLSSVPLNPDEHANHPNHQKIAVNHNGNVGVGNGTPETKIDIHEDLTLNEVFRIKDTGTNPDASMYQMPFSTPTLANSQYCDVTLGGNGKYFLFAMSEDAGRWVGFVYCNSSQDITATVISNNNITVGNSGSRKVKITNTSGGSSTIDGFFMALDSYGTLTVGSAAGP